MSLRNFFSKCGGVRPFTKIERILWLQW